MTVFRSRTVFWNWVYKKSLHGVLFAKKKTAQWCLLEQRAISWSSLHSAIHSILSFSHWYLKIIFLDLSRYYIVTGSCHHLHIVFGKTTLVARVSNVNSFFIHVIWNWENGGKPSRLRSRIISKALLFLFYLRFSNKIVNYFNTWNKKRAVRSTVQTLGLCD